MTHTKQRAINEQTKGQYDKTQTPEDTPCGLHGPWSLQLVHSWSFLRVAVRIKIFCKSAGRVETITDKRNNVNYKELWGKILIRKVLRYQRSNHNPYIEEEQTTQWPKEKAQKVKQWSTKHTYKSQDRVTRTPLKTGGELRCSGRVSSSSSTSGTRRVNLVTNLVTSHERGKDRKRCLRQMEHIRGHLWGRYSIAVNQVMVATVKLSKVMTSN